jgi:hypothetical protein
MFFTRYQSCALFPSTALVPRFSPVLSLDAFSIHLIFAFPIILSPLYFMDKANFFLGEFWVF